MEGSQRNNRRHLAVEVLEDRTLLAASSLSSYHQNYAIDVIVDPLIPRNAM